jgi:hypothetical protein
LTFLVSSLLLQSSSLILLLLFSNINLTRILLYLKVKRKRSIHCYENNLTYYYLLFIISIISINSFVFKIHKQMAEFNLKASRRWARKVFSIFYLVKKKKKEFKVWNKLILFSALSNYFNGERPIRKAYQLFLYGRNLKKARTNPILISLYS